MDLRQSAHNWPVVYTQTVNRGCPFGGNFKMTLDEIKKQTNWVILELFNEVERLKEEVKRLQETKSDKRKSHVKK